MPQFINLKYFNNRKKYEMITLNKLKIFHCIFLLSNKSKKI